MKTNNNIENLLKKIRLSSTPAMDQKVHQSLTNALHPAGKKTMTSPAQNIWRTIMKNKLTKLSTAAAAAVIITVIIATQFFTATEVSLAQAIDNMKKMPWLHTTAATTIPGAPPFSDEFWYSFDPQIYINIESEGGGGYFGSEGGIGYFDVENNIGYFYSPDSSIVNKRYITKNYPPLEDLSSPQDVLEMFLNRYADHDVRPSRKTGNFKGQHVEIFEFQMTQEGIAVSDTVYIDPQKNLIIGTHCINTDPDGNLLYQGHLEMDYPDTGPASIYDLIPEPVETNDDHYLIHLQYNKYRHDFPDHYLALEIPAASQEAYSDSRTINRLTVFYQQGNRARQDKYVITPPYLFNPEMELTTFPAVQLLLQQPGFSLRETTIDDGQFLHNIKYSSKAEPVHKKRENRPDENLNLIIENAWPQEVLWPNIIEDEYSRQNNLICALNTTDPQLGQFIYDYYDPSRDYIRRKSHTKHANGDQSLIEVTHFAQTQQGQWYPARIEKNINHKAFGGEYIEINNYYLITCPPFPDDLFNPEKLPIKK